MNSMIKWIFLAVLPLCCGCHLPPYQTKLSVGQDFNKPNPEVRIEITIPQGGHSNW